MADRDSDSSINDIIQDWTMVNRFGEVESDDHAELTSERSEESESSVHHSSPSQTELQGSSMPREDLQPETVTDDAAAAAANAVDVEHETTAGAEPMPDKVGEQSVNSKVAGACEPEHKKEEKVVDVVSEKADELHALRDTESLSSGSSIELLDMLEEGQDHPAAATGSDSQQKVVEMPSDGDKENWREASDPDDGKQFSTAPESSSDLSNSSAGSEGLTGDGGETVSVTTAVEPEVDSSKDAADAMPSNLAEHSVDSDNHEDYDKGIDTAAERSDECQQSVHEAELLQLNDVTSSITDRTDGSESHDPSLSEATSSVDEAEWLNQIDSVCEGFDQQADEPDGDADIEKAEIDESIDTEADMSIVSSVNSSDDIDMLPDVHLADAPGDAVEAEAENIDDRCESDISGVVSDDSDLSSMSSGADIAMETGNLVYRHQPNPVFNTLLTCCAVLMMCFALGIGIGHYFGSSTMPSLCDQQLQRLKTLQDEQYLCLGQLEQYENRLQTMSDTEHKLSAVTAVWVRKYEELVKERARLEQLLNVSQQVNEKTMDMVDDCHRKLNDSQTAVQFVALEVDRLLRELAASNESRHSSDLAAAEWKSKYETAQLELEGLEQELMSTRAEANEVEQSLDIARRDVARLNEHRTSSHGEVQALHDEITALKNVVNQQKLEKAELEGIILNQRYGEHPGNIATPADNIDDNYSPENDVTQEINGLNEDTISTSPNTSVNPADELSMEFVRVQKLLGRVTVELHKDDGVESGGGLVVENRLTVPRDAVFMTMLKYVMTSGRQSSGLDLPSQMTAYTAALRHVADCIEVLDNLTVNRQLAKTLMSPWNQLRVEGSLSRQVVRAFEQCRQQFASVVNSKGDTVAADLSSVVDSVLRQYMNKTLETVSQLSHTVQTTLDRMKTLPEELFADNKTAKKIARKLTEAVSKLNSKVQSGWKHVASKFKDMRRKWFGYSESKKMCKHKRTEQHKKHMPSKIKSGGKFPGRHFPEPSGKVEDKRQSYKQTKPGKQEGEYSSRKHAEDLSRWSQLDDFFEDNHRAWRQHNSRRLQKIGAGIGRLNEDMFLSMDDDDVEDIYEDLKDVGEEMEKRDQSEDLRTWMSCQLRWWKTRIHRKHRAEDLVKGCGRQLMRWQLRVLCKQRNVEKVASTLPYSRLCDTPMVLLKPGPDDHRKHPYNTPHADTPQDPRSFVTAEDLTKTAITNDTCSDGEWYFRRVQDREDRRQLSPQWYFDRVDDRHFSRGDANWYVRAMRHNSAISAVTVDNRQRPSPSAGNEKGDTGQN